MPSSIWSKTAITTCMICSKRSKMCWKARSSDALWWENIQSRPASYHSTTWIRPLWTCNLLADASLSCSKQIGCRQLRGVLGPTTKSQTDFWMPTEMCWNLTIWQKYKDCGKCSGMIGSSVEPRVQKATDMCFWVCPVWPVAWPCTITCVWVT